MLDIGTYLLSLNPFLRLRKFDKFAFITLAYRLSAFRTKEKSSIIRGKIKTTKINLD
jgi:hypothetical protein